MDARWTLDELAAQMRATGVADEASRVNGQVGEAPNARTVRYYTTIGVLDRPVLHGRTAMYGRRHLEQLVAVKRLQAKGLVLADIQRELVGLDDAGLAALAALPADTAPHGPQPHEESRRERTFWSAAPAEPAPVEIDAVRTEAPGVAVGQSADALPRGGRQGFADAGRTRGVTGVQLTDGVTLAFPAARTVNDDDKEALRAALDQVVEILRARGLLP